MNYLRRISALSLFVILFMVCSFSLTHAAVNKSQNLLTNSGFEKGKRAWLGSGNVRRHDERSGRRSLAIMGTRTSNLNIYQTIQVKPGYSYQFTGWKKEVHKSKGKYRFRVSWFNKHGNEISSSRRYFGEGRKGHVYVKHSVKYTAPSKAVKAKLYLEAISANGIGYFDDISIAVAGKKPKKNKTNKKSNEKYQLSKTKNIKAQKKYASKLIAKDDYFTVKQGEKSTFNLLANDQGITKDTKLKVLAQPKQGKVIVTNNGQVQYQPSKDYFGQDDFIYQLTDGKGNKHLASASIQIKCVKKCQQSFNLSWEKSRSKDVIGYKVYVGRTMNDFDQVYMVKNKTNFKYLAKQKGDYYFAIKSLNRHKMESKYSGIVKGAF